MRLQTIKNFAIAGVFATAALGCGDVDFGTPDQAKSVEREQAVTVVPEFSVSGTSELPGELYLSQLGLTISEIRLEPLETEYGSIAYSTRNPTRLSFDVARGETLKLGEPIQLPSAGRYLVSVRLEPITEIEESDEGAREKISPSLSVAGFIAGEGVVGVDPRYDEKRSDGSPVPVPFDEREDSEDGEMQDMPALPTEWTPFHYDSQRSVFFTLNEVEFDAGRQYLSFDFNVQDWALDLVDPLLNAVRHNSDSPTGPSDGVDVTSPLDSTGHGAESLFENASVRTMAEGRAGM